MEKLIAEIKYYEQIITVELPVDYNKFINCLSEMLQIPEEMIEKFKIFYIDINYKEFVIKNCQDYSNFLYSVKYKKTEILNIELIDNIEEKKKLQNQYIILQKKEDKEKVENDRLNNPYKEYIFKEDTKLIGDNRKLDSGSILSNIKNIENIEFSFLDEEKLNNEKKEKNIGRNLIFKYKSNNDNIINKNINSYYGQNKLVDNQIRGAPIQINFNIECFYCKKNKMNGIAFYCKNCSIFFCYNCEEEIGKNHQHCYYKIRNIEQFREISDIHNNLNNQIKNPYDININSISNNNFIQNKITDIISEGSKIIESKLHNTYNSIINFFNLNNNNNNNNADIKIFNRQNFKRNNNIQNNNINDIKTIIEQAKSQYNLEQIGDDEIERALIITKGNIDKAVGLLFSNHN